jgi:hypothetical protein
MVSEQIRISAKTLGAVALADFCPRCFWIRLRVHDKLPFQIFPGIFSSIDSYNKRIVHRWFDRHGGPPPWLSSLGDIVGYREPPHFSKFNMVQEEFNLLLTGAPDAVFVREDRSHLIADYKTARYTGFQDRLLPMYRAQLNVYAAIGEQCGLKPVSGLALIYMEPVTGDDVIDQDDSHREDGFILGFAATIVTVRRDEETLYPLFAKTREIHEFGMPPAGRPGCKDCGLLGQLLQVAGA